MAAVAVAEAAVLLVVAVGAGGGAGGAGALGGLWLVTRHERRSLGGRLEVGVWMGGVWRLDSPWWSGREGLAGLRGAGGGGEMAGMGAGGRRGL